MLKKTRQNGMYYIFIPLLTWEVDGKRVRRSEKFLRSFGKRREALLPTFLLTIN
jgi:hypothetical protein